MAEDAAEFAQFAVLAMAESSNAAPELTQPAPEEAAAPPPGEVKPEPAEPEIKHTKGPANESELKPEVPPDWKRAAELERQKRAAKNASKANELRLSAQLAEMQNKLARYEAIEAKKATDPLGAAEEFGLSYDAMTKEYIKTLEKNPEQPDAQTKSLIQKIQRIEGLLEQQQQTIAQRAQSEAIQSFQSEVKKVIEASSEEFELVKTARQGPDLVREIVAAHYRATATFDKQGNIISAGELMPTEQACKLAEKYLEEDLSQFKGTKKFGGKVEAPKPVAKPATPTLSQDMRQGGVKPEPHGDEVEQLLTLKKTLEAQLNAQQG